MARPRIMDEARVSAATEVSQEAPGSEAVLVLAPETAEYAHTSLRAPAAAGVSSNNPARGTGEHDPGDRVDAIGRLLDVLGACGGAGREPMRVDVAADGEVLLLALRYERARERAACSASDEPARSRERRIAHFIEHLGLIWEAYRPSRPVTLVGVTRDG